MHAPVEDFADIAADVLARVRDRAPLVHCITNTVAQNFTANVLLAAGAAPSMTVSPEEIIGFVTTADALLINLGTFDAERRDAVDLALGAAEAARTPWVLDPVLVDRSSARAAFAVTLLRRGPKAVRLNHSEFAALFGGEASDEATARAAKACGAVVALTGGIDVVADGTRRAVIRNGHPLMGLVTAMGCAGSALLGAALAVEVDAWHAAIAAVAVLGVAGEIAGASAAGPGSFAVAIIDALHGLDRAALRARIKVT